MEASADFQLSWPNHQATLLAAFDTLLANEKLADCTITAEGKSIKAHKIILAACSPFFEQLLTENHEKYPIIILPDAKFHVTKALLGFMYHGQLNVQQDELTSVLKLSEFLQVKGLSGSGYIGGVVVGTPRKAGGNPLTISTDNHSCLPSISSVYTLCSQESSEMEIKNSFEEPPRPHSSQENNPVEMDSVTSVSRTCEKLHSAGNMELASFNDASVYNGFQISDETETLPVTATVTDQTDSRAVSACSKNSQSRGSAERAKGTKSTAKKDLVATRKLARTRKVASKQVTCSERNIGQVAHETKVADEVDTLMGIAKYVTNSGSAAGNGSINRRSKLKRKLRGKSKCPVCGEIFESRPLLESHFLHGCRKERQVQCSHCKLSFSRKGHLKRHLLTHRCLKPSPSRRQTCG